MYSEGGFLPKGVSGGRGSQSSDGGLSMCLNDDAFFSLQDFFFTPLNITLLSCFFFLISRPIPPLPPHITLAPAEEKNVKREKKNSV